MRGVLSLVLHPRRLAILVAGTVATVLYVWVAAVRAAPAVRRRKKAARAAWRGRDRRGRVGA